MTAKTPYLLTLPREIRDKTYSHLHRVVKLPWLMSGDFENIDSRVILEVQVDNLPLHEMLLVNHCLHDEYLESLDLSITFDLKRPNSEPPPRSELERTLENAFPRTACHFLRYVRRPRYSSRLLVPFRTPYRPFD